MDVESPSGGRNGARDNQGYVISDYKSKKDGAQLYKNDVICILEERTVGWMYVKRYVDGLCCWIPSQKIKRGRKASDDLLEPSRSPMPPSRSPEKEEGRSRSASAEDERKYHSERPFRQDSPIRRSRFGSDPTFSPTSSNRSYHKRSLFNPEASLDDIWNEPGNHFLWMSSLDLETMAMKTKRSRQNALRRPWGPDPPFWFELLEYPQKKLLLEMVRDKRGLDIAELMKEGRLLADQAAEFVQWKKLIDMKLSKWVVTRIANVRIKESHPNGSPRERVVGNLQVGAVCWGTTETKKVRKGTMLANETHCIHIIKPIDGFVLTHNWKGLEYIKRIPNPNESVSRLQIDESTVRRLESNESTTTDSSFSRKAILPQWQQLHHQLDKLKAKQKRMIEASHKSGPSIHDMTAFLSITQEIGQKQAEIDTKLRKAQNNRRRAVDAQDSFSETVILGRSKDTMTKVRSKSYDNALNDTIERMASLRSEFSLNSYKHSSRLGSVASGESSYPMSPVPSMNNYRSNFDSLASNLLSPSVMSDSLNKAGRSTSDAEYMSSPKRRATKNKENWSLKVFSPELKMSTCLKINPETTVKEVIVMFCSKYKKYKKNFDPDMYILICEYYDRNTHQICPADSFFTEDICILSSQRTRKPLLTFKIIPEHDSPVKKELRHLDDIWSDTPQSPKFKHSIFKNHVDSHEIINYIKDAFERSGEETLTPEQLQVLQNKYNVPPERIQPFIDLSKTQVLSRSPSEFLRFVEEKRRPTRKRGWMEKQGPGLAGKAAGLMGRAWKRRLFVLDVETDSLKYYVNESKKPRGEIPLSNPPVHVREKRRLDDDKFFYFEIVTPKRTYVLRTFSDVDRDEWMSVLDRTSDENQLLQRLAYRIHESEMSQACIDIGAFSRYRDIGYLLTTKEGQDALRKYLDREYCSEFVDFVVSVRDFQKEAKNASPKRIHEMAQNIYEVFISPNGKKVIVHDASKINHFKKRLRDNDATEDMFDDLLSFQLKYLAKEKARFFSSNIWRQMITTTWTMFTRLKTILEKYVSREEKVLSIIISFLPKDGSAMKSVMQEASEICLYEDALSPAVLELKNPRLLSGNSHITFPTRYGSPSRSKRNQKVSPKIPQYPSDFKRKSGPLIKKSFSRTESYNMPVAPRTYTH